MADKEPIPVYQVPAPQPPRAGPAPSTTRLVPDQAQVVVDQWGHRGELIRGMVVDRASANEAGYDFDHAVQVGALRLLSEAEVRSLPTTFAANPDGTPDEGLARAVRFHSGIVTDLPRTVTTPPGFAEPEQFAKPTIPALEGGEPAARPVEVVDSPEQARSAGALERRVVATPSGPAFATPAEARAAEEAEAKGESAQVAVEEARAEEAKTAERESSRRGRKE